MTSLVEGDKAVTTRVTASLPLLPYKQETTDVPNGRTSIAMWSRIPLVGDCDVPPVGDAEDGSLR
jgi:hypothetical protein